MTTALLLILAGLAAPANAACRADTLSDALKRTAGAAFVPPAPAQVQQAGALFLQHFAQTATPAERRERWQALGFVVESLCADNHAYWLIHAADDQRNGRGAFVFRAQSDAQLVLQAPHRHADWGTGRLALALLREGQVRALALNTAPRRQPSENGDGVADLAHLPVSYLQAFTEAQARALPGSRLVQIHGFSPDKRKSAAGRAATMILSAGRPRVSAHAHVVHACLYQAHRDAVRLFPATIQELGGTRNVQGQLFSQLGQDGFLHLEISRAWREQLLSSPESRQVLLACLRA